MTSDLNVTHCPMFLLKDFHANIGGRTRIPVRWYQFQCLHFVPCRPLLPMVPSQVSRELGYFWPRLIYVLRTDTARDGSASTTSFSAQRWMAVLR